MKDNNQTKDHKNLHEWDVLARCCIDGRFIKRTVEWVVSQAGDVFDFRTGVGSTKTIIDSLYDRASFFDVIKTSIKLHNIKEVWLIDHVDCGAYGGSKAFANEDKERTFHIGKLIEAAKIVKDEFPKLTVRKMYVSWDSVEEI
jgi:carbonic anhydrase